MKFHTASFSLFERRCETTRMNQKIRGNVVEDKRGYSSRLCHLV